MQVSPCTSDFIIRIHLDLSLARIQLSLHRCFTNDHKSYILDVHSRRHVTTSSSSCATWSIFLYFLDSTLARIASPPCAQDHRYYLHFWTPHSHVYKSSLHPDHHSYIWTPALARIQDLDSTLVTYTSPPCNQITSPTCGLYTRTFQSPPRTQMIIPTSEDCDTRTYTRGHPIQMTNPVRSCIWTPHSYVCKFSLHPDRVTLNTIRTVKHVGTYTGSGAPQRVPCTAIRAQARSFHLFETQIIIATSGRAPSFSARMSRSIRAHRVVTSPTSGPLTRTHANDLPVGDPLTIRIIHLDSINSHRILKSSLHFSETSFPHLDSTLLQRVQVLRPPRSDKSYIHGDPVTRTYARLLVCAQIQSFLAVQRLHGFARIQGVLRLAHLHGNTSPPCTQIIFPTSGLHTRSRIQVLPAR